MVMDNQEFAKIGTLLCSGRRNIAFLSRGWKECEGSRPECPQRASRNIWVGLLIVMVHLVYLVMSIYASNICSNSMVLNATSLV